MGRFERGEPFSTWLQSLRRWKDVDVRGALSGSGCLSPSLLDLFLSSARTTCTPACSFSPTPFFKTNPILDMNMAGTLTQSQGHHFHPGPDVVISLWKPDFRLILCVRVSILATCLILQSFQITVLKAWCAKSFTRVFWVTYQKYGLWVNIQIHWIRISRAGV